ncbi:AzlD domain-containing protein [Lacrimispora sp. 210928-DFI.3.58]|uniref:branched-chain amino acid transporter permease n=1 Tax=Lacrimispora sp. 210928-DFI.3.58 TaxID=2883214 RepID=UPI001D062BBA|nr:AzlD domain-containing protein [Lacrimispora sp. 210928-DFI.3.58]
MIIENNRYILITILICALCTQITRWLPFLLFGGKKEIPCIIRYLGAILPAAIMAVLVVYCLKGITPLAYPYGLPELLSVAVVVLLHLWKRNTLASIALGTVCYMVLVQMIF